MKKCKNKTKKTEIGNCQMTNKKDKESKRIMKLPMLSDVMLDD